MLTVNLLSKQPKKGLHLSLNWKGEDLLRLETKKKYKTMEIKKDELGRIKEYLRNEYPEQKKWSLFGNTSIADKTLIEKNDLEVYSYVHIHEGEKHSSVYMSVSVRPLNQKVKVDKLGLNLDVYSLEQLKNAESKAEELLEMAKRLDVWK